MKVGNKATPSAALTASEWFLKAAGFGVRVSLSEETCGCENVSVVVAAARWSLNQAKAWCGERLAYIGLTGAGPTFGGNLFVGPGPTQPPRCQLVQRLATASGALKTNSKKPLLFVASISYFLVLCLTAATLAALSLTA
jgi:hypothetical protein